MPLDLPIVEQLRDGVVRVGFLTQIETDKIIGRLFVKLFLLFLGNDVVGRRDDFAQIFDFLLIVKDSTKRRDAYHYV